MSFSYPTESLREFDRRMDASGKCGVEHLMRLAGAAVAEAVESLRSQREGDKCTVVLVGKGNNGGDALVAASMLHNAGWAVQLVLAVPPEELAPLPRRIWEELPETLRAHVRTGLPENALQSSSLSRAMILDGLLGTGFDGGRPREALASLIEAANASGLPILSIDLPSGLNGDTGKAELCIQATATVCLCAVKTGLLHNQGVAASGRLILAPLPGDALHEKLPRGPEVFDETDARKILPRISFDAHKFQRGMVTVLGGSRQYGGAPILAGSAALHVGAGLVQVVLPGRCETFCQAPQALIVRRLPDTGADVLDAAILPSLHGLLARSNALAVGPGMTHSPALLPVLAELLGLDKPMVLDADALNLLATCPALLAHDRPAPTILTPHAGEFARLQKAFGISPDCDRAKDALTLAERTGCVVVLKGARTVVASPGGSFSYNLSGCAALATAGSGDVLTGVISALLANGLKAEDAARLGVWLHGAAAERATRPGAPVGLIADELPLFIRQTLAEMY